jgi:hypothetical protein
MVEWIDPSVVDEQNTRATDASLDMYYPTNGPPYDAPWLQRYRVAQCAATTASPTTSVERELWQLK